MCTFVGSNIKKWTLIIHYIHWGDAFRGRREGWGETKVLLEGTLHLIVSYDRFSGNFLLILLHPVGWGIISQLANLIHCTFKGCFDEAIWIYVENYIFHMVIMCSYLYEFWLLYFFYNWCLSLILPFIEFMVFKQSRRQREY